MTGVRSFVTLDLGNARLKWRRWAVRPGGPPDVAARGAHPSRAGLVAAVLAELDGALRGAGEPERVVLACVASPALEDELASALAARFGARFDPRPDPGLVLDVERPDTVGADRLFAARGAHARLGTPALVVDAGTCVTVDAVDLAPDGRAPRFRGGAIAPGPELLAGALARGGARLFEVDVHGPVAALGRDTASALRAGVVVGLRGAVRELVAGIGAATGLEAAPIAWTGGAVELLLAPPLLPERRNAVEPELVHLGLLAAAGVDVRVAP
jgi:type III pantothenate kinase